MTFVDAASATRRQPGQIKLFGAEAFEGMRKAGRLASHVPDRHAGAQCRRDLRVLAGSGWLGLRDREAHVTRGVSLTPMFTGLLALAALLAFITLAWWREGR